MSDCPPVADAAQISIVVREYVKASEQASDESVEKKVAALRAVAKTGPSQSGLAEKMMLTANADGRVSDGEAKTIEFWSRKMQPSVAQPLLAEVGSLRQRAANAAREAANARTETVKKRDAAISKLNAAMGQHTNYAVVGTYVGYNSHATNDRYAYENLKPHVDEYKKQLNAALVNLEGLPFEQLTGDDRKLLRANLERFLFKPHVLRYDPQRFDDHYDLEDSGTIARIQSLLKRL